MEPRVSRLEYDLNDLRATMNGLAISVAEIKAMLNATLPHLATKAELAALRTDLAEKPGKAYMWGVLSALITAYGMGLAALAILK